MQLLEILYSITVFDIVDIAVISFITYKALKLIGSSRTAQMAISVVAIITLLGVAKFLGLKTTSWLISNLTGYFFLMIIIVFQPEIRRALTSLGKTKFFSVNKKPTSKMLEEIIRSCVILANRQIGALIVLEKNTDIMPVITVGQHIDSEVSRDLLISIFIPYSPLHDGAVLINNSRLQYAGCILPLTKRENINHKYGTRHRAAIGITEETDAIAIVVSEERGSISVAYNGTLSDELSAENLYNTLTDIFNMDKDKETGE